MSKARKVPIDSPEPEETKVDEGSLKRLTKIVNALRLPFRKERKAVKEELSVEKLIAVGRRKTRTEMERLRKETQVQRKAEILYRLDPLIFSGVNRLRRLIVSPRIYFVGGDEQDRSKMEAWAKAVGLKKILWNAVMDILIYGYAAIEKVRDSNGLVVKLVLIDPKAIDWKKEGGKIVLGDNGEPVGFEWMPEAGAQKEFLPRKDVILLNFFTLGLECLGISPLEPAFKPAWIRLNLEEAYGEACYRHGFPQYYFKIGDAEHEVTPQLIKRARKILRNFDTVNELILPHWIEPGRLDPRNPLRGVPELWLYLAGEVARALDNPLGSLLPTQEGGGKGTLEYANLDLERAVIQYQQSLVEQLEEQLLAEVRIAKDLTSIPELRFAEGSPETQMLRMKMIALLSSKNALHIDRKTENQLRAELNLPMLSEEVKTASGHECVFNPNDTCDVRAKEDIPLSDLFKYCQVCPKIKKKEKLDS